jgi:hypothetical protein
MSFEISRVLSMSILKRLWAVSCGGLWLRCDVTR